MQGALLDAATAPQRAVLDAYLRAPRGGPVLAIGAGVVIADAAVTALEVDHAQLWEEVRGRADGDVVLLGDLPARVGVAPDAVTLTVVGGPRPRPAPERRDGWAQWLPLRLRLAAAGRRLTPLERAEAQTIAAVLAECGGNRSAAARALGISRSALYAKLRTYRL